MSRDILERIDKIGDRTLDMHCDVDLLSIFEKSTDYISLVMDVAGVLRDMYFSGVSPRVFNTGIAVSVFKDEAVRFRNSYISSANLLGLRHQDLDIEKYDLKNLENLDIDSLSNVLSIMARCIGIRDCSNYGVGQVSLEKVKEIVDREWERKSFPFRPSILNLKSDVDSPVQALSDLLYLKNVFGDLNSLKNKKFVLSWGYSPRYDKPLAVTQGVLVLVSQFFGEIVLASPESISVSKEVMDLVKGRCMASGNKFSISDDLGDACRGADVVYVKSWASPDVLEQKSSFIHNQDRINLENLRIDTLAKNSKFKNWEYNQNIENLTKNSSARLMHSLPADVSDYTTRFGEISLDSFEKHRAHLLNQTSFQSFVMSAATLVGQYLDDTKGVLKRIMERKRDIKL